MAPSAKPSPAPPAPRLSGKIARGVAGLLLAGAAFGLVSVLYRRELGEVSAWAFTWFGLGGVFLLLFLADAIASPVPTGTFLLWITWERFPERWWLLVPLIGIVSALAGYAAYFGGRYLGRKSFFLRITKRFRQEHEATLLKAAPLGVAAGALTPIPFALMLWTAGLLRVPFARVWAPSLLRVLRYLLLYAALAWSGPLWKNLLGS